MTLKRSARAVFGAAAMALGLAAPAMAEDVALKLHQFLPAQANVPKLILEPWADSVEKASGGTITIGVADIVWTAVGYTPGRFPSTEVFELPFMMDDARAASRAFWQMFNTHMKDTEFKDVVVLGTWVHGPGLIHTSRPVETPADLNGLKIRGGSRPVSALLEQLGATPVGMPVPAVPEALAKGVLDGATVPWEVTGALKLPDLLEYHTEFTGRALYTLAFVLVMNKDTFDSLTPEQQAAIMDQSGEAFSVFAGGVMQDTDAPAREAALDLGNTVITLDAEATDEWRTLAQPIYQDWVADMAGRGIDGQALIDEARALMAQPLN